MSKRKKRLTKRDKRRKNSAQYPGAFMSMGCDGTAPYAEAVQQTVPTPHGNLVVHGVNSSGEPLTRPIHRVVFNDNNYLRSIATQNIFKGTNQ